MWASDGCSMSRAASCKPKHEAGGFVDSDGLLVNQQQLCSVSCDVARGERVGVAGAPPCLAWSRFWQEPILLEENLPMSAWE